MNNIFGVLLTFLLGIFILIGACLSFLSKDNKKIIDLSIGIAFGVMIMLILTDLLPESLEKFNGMYTSFYGYLLTIIGLLIGFLLLKVFDIFIPDHDDDAKENLEHIGIVSTIALVLHNIIEGMAVYSIFTNSPNTALLLSVGVGLHNLPLGMIISLLLYKKNSNKKSIIISISLLSLSTFVGGIIMYLLSSYVSEFLLACLISVTTGMIIYIISCELLPRIVSTKSKTSSIVGIVIGIAIMLLSLIF